MSPVFGIYVCLSAHFRPSPTPFIYYSYGMYTGYLDIYLDKYFRRNPVLRVGHKRGGRQ